MHEEEKKSVSSQPSEKKKKNKKVKKTQAELLIQDALGLLIKIVAIIAFATFVFTFMFGVYRNNDPSMIPAIQDGDLVFYYRLDKRYVSSDVLVAEYGEKKLSLRVVAVAGDTVDIREEGLFINGFLQQESKIYEATKRFADGVDFPLTVQEGQVFVLGDSRENSSDSRIFGAVDITDTYGKVITIIRRRGI